MDYNFMIEHCPGVLNIVPDALSWLYEPEPPVIDTQFARIEGLADEVTAVDSTTPANNDTEMVPVDDAVKAIEGISSAVDEADNTTNSTSIGGTTTRMLKAMPEQLSLISAMHALGHFGAKMLTSSLHSQGYEWPTLEADIVAVMANCTACQCFNPKHMSYHPLVLIMATFPMDHVAIDFAGPYCITEAGNVYVMVM
ncbi:hypothetical protein H4S07_002566, partial [Coemansia furcata]